MPRLEGDDRTAVGWAWTTGTPIGQVLRARVERGERAAPTAEELATIRREWETAGRPPPEVHVHCDEVHFADGTRVRAVSFAPETPYSRESAPDYGVYLDERWDPPWPHEHVRWPDFGVPDPAELAAAFERLVARARAGELVEIGCAGGHGRTGTALACMAVLSGTPRQEAVAWVRDTYCRDAVETKDQRAFVEGYAV